MSYIIIAGILGYFFHEVFKLWTKKNKPVAKKVAKKKVAKKTTKKAQRQKKIKR